MKNNNQGGVVNSKDQQSNATLPSNLTNLN